MPTASAVTNTTTPITESKVADTKEADAKTMDSAKSDSSQTTKTDEVAKETAKPSKDNSRPISSTPVPGTPWCVVWTGDERAFFFNPSQRLSVWERPEELKGRVDVDRFLEKHPADQTDSPIHAQDNQTGQNAGTTEEVGESAAKRPRL